VSRKVVPDSDVHGMIQAEDETVPELEGQIRSGKLAGKSLAAAMFILATPVFLEHLLAAFVGLVDKMLTGGLPEEIATAALDGVGIGSYVGWFMGIAISGVGIGAQALIARALGGGNEREAAHGLGQAMVFSVFWGIAIGFVLHAAAPLLAEIGNLTEEGRLYCIQYVRTISFGVPFSAIMFIGIMSLHGAGETTRPFLIMIVVNIVNIVASWYLSGAVIAFGGYAFVSPGDGGVIGIALGTVIARGAGALLLLGLVIRGVKDLRLEGWALRPHFGMIWRIVRIGVPSFFEGMGMWIGNLLVLGVVGQIAAQQRIGDGLLGAHIIAVQWEAFSFLPGFAMGIAASTLAGQYLGAKNPRMASRAMLACAGVAMAFMGLWGVVFCLFGRPLTAVISSDPYHLATVPSLLFICGIVQVNFAVGMVLRTGMRGAGDTTWAMIITWTGTYLVRLPAAYIIGLHLGYGLKGVWIGLCGELAVRSFLFGARFLHGGWTKVKV
jgi:putative MATE family efflux protein